MVRLFALMALLVGVGLVIRTLFKPQLLAEITVDCDGVRKCTGLPAAGQSEILDFVARKVVTDRKVVIRIERGQNQLSVHCRGPIDSGTEQLVRNFLLSKFR